MTNRISVVGDNTDANERMQSQIVILNATVILKETL
jgi:hypothetical protein